MSRLRRPFLSDRYIFVTVKLLKLRARLQERDYQRWAHPLARIRLKHGFLLTPWAFLPEHWHAIIYPPYPLTISTVLKALKVSSLISINLGRGPSRELWPGRFFDRALRTVREYHETVEYIHLNPVWRGLVKRAEDWKWSSAHEYAGISGEEQAQRCGLRIDRLRLPTDENTPI